MFVCVGVGVWYAFYIYIDYKKILFVTLVKTPKTK